MAALSWEEIVERGKQHNKTVICEVEKRHGCRYFTVRCTICESEKNSLLSGFKNCHTCSSNKTRRSTEEFINLSKRIHGEKYDYNLVEYTNKRTKIKIFCKACNELFLQRPCSHLKGGGCNTCAINQKKDDTNSFVMKSKAVHKNKYNYDLVQYSNSLTKVRIICKQCNNIFEQLPSDHISGHGCRKCGFDFVSNLHRSSTEEFIIKARQKHDDRYSYDLVTYVHACEKVKIICNKCQFIFNQQPNNHLSGAGCPRCVIRSKPQTTEQFIFKANSKHLGKYDYSLVDYVNTESKVKIKCNKCNNIFKQSPSVHLGGSGCSKCRESKGENKVAKYLVKNNISFTPQKIFKTLKYKSYLKPDFYLEDFNLLIEYDGEFHFKALIGLTPEIKQKNLEVQQQRDKIKNEWAKANNIPLLRIPYWDFDRIEELIEAFILQHTKKKEIKQLVLEM
jgi:hypothetical protein